MSKLCRIFVFFSAIHAFGNFPVFLFDQGFPLVPWHSYVVLLGCTLMLAMFNLRSLLQGIPRYMVIWIWLYFIHSILMFLYSSQDPQGLDMLKARIVDIAQLGTFLMMLNLRPEMARIAQKAILWVVLFSILMNIMDFVDPAFSRVGGRAAGFYLNPNYAGRILSLGMLASLPLVRPRLRLMFCLLVGVAVIITFSRSGWLNWALAIITATTSGYLVFRHKWPSILFFSMLGLLMIYVLFSGLALELLAALNLSGYLTPDTLARVSGFGITFDDFSTTERTKLVEDSWEVIKHHPLIGSGTDLHRWFQRVLPHNMYLLSMASGGFPGLLLFLALIWLLWRNTTDLGRAITVVYIFSSLFTHNNLDGSPTLLLIALVATLRPNRTLAQRTVRQQTNGSTMNLRLNPSPSHWNQMRSPP